MPNTQQTDNLEFVKKAGEALQHSRELAQSVHDMEQKVAEFIPQQVSQLLEAGLITELEKEGAAPDALRDHAKCLDILNRTVAVYINQKQAHVAQLAEMQQKLEAAGLGVAENSPSHAKQASEQSQGLCNLDSGNFAGVASERELRLIDEARQTATI